MKETFSRNFMEVLAFPEMKCLNRDLLLSVTNPERCKTEFVADALRSHISSESSRLRLIIDEQEQIALRMRDALHNTPTDSEAHKWAELMVEAYKNQPEQIFLCQASERSQKDED